MSLEINGSVDPVQDRQEMVRAKFDRQIKALFNKELTDAGKPPVAADELNLEPSDYARLVPIAYSNTFGAYHPPATNLPAAATALLPAKNPSAATRVAKNVPTRFRFPYEHGATRMVDEEHQNDAVPAPRRLAAPPPRENGQPPASALAMVPQTLQADMENQLMQKIDITSDDFRQLMQARASQVEAYLLKSGKVTADRLFITAPKPIGPDFKGADRANLTLD